jgi:hypothetical protein
LHPRIDSEMKNHLGYVDGALKGREFFVGNSLTGADIQMSFVGEMAKCSTSSGPIRISPLGWRGCTHGPRFSARSRRAERTGLRSDRRSGLEPEPIRRG